MKLQFEFYLLFFTKQLNRPTKYISLEKLELFLDFLYQLFQFPTFAVDLYVNYDCDVSCGDILEHLLQALLKIAFPEQGTINSCTLLSLDCLATIINQIAMRTLNQVSHLNHMMDL
jgi:brefeldin A-resistance guanine nucleotide exchange factor 1